VALFSYCGFIYNRGNTFNCITMSLLGNYLTIRVQQHASGTVNEVVAESTSVDCQFTAEAMEKTVKSDALTAKYEPGLCKINVSGDYLLASDAEQFTNLFTHANNGDKIEVDIYRSSTLVMSTEGVFTSLSKSGALSDSLVTGAYSLELDASALEETYGEELYTLSNAAADPAGTEADATTGWDSAGLDGTGSNVFESQNSVVNEGAYALHANSEDTPTANARITLDLEAAPFSFTNGDEGKITLNWRHIGSGGQWRMCLSDNGTNIQDLFSYVGDTDTSFIAVEHTWTHSANSKYLSIREYSASNDGGFYLDNISIKKKN
jgi:hypothetical protein